MPEHPFQIDRYRILHEIGSGGMATVYAAIQPRPRRTVALKVLKSDAASDTAVRRFKREAEILARLRHPAIAQVYDAGTYEDKGKIRPFFVMEYIPGAKTILEFVAQKQLNRRERLKLFVNVCRAVEYGHRHRVLHRDLKPGNILIDQSGQLKIIDFGVASAPDLKVKGTTMHTEAGVLVGTIQYMSPEQVASHPHDLDPRSDVYSLGVLLYKLMTGQFPHDLEGLPIYEAVRLIREEDPIRPSAREAELKGDLETIILRAIARDAAQRYQSAGALAADIVQHLNKQPIAAKPPAQKKEKSSNGPRTALVAIVLVFLLAIGAGGAWWWFNRDATIVPNTSDAAPSTAADTPVEPDQSTRTKPFVLDAQNGRITALAMDANGERIASAAHDDSIVIWNVLSHAPLITFYEHRAPPIAVLFIGDGSRCMSIDENGVLLEWNTRDSSVLHKVQSPSQKIRAIAITSGGDRVALACEDGTVRISALAQPNWTTLRGNTGTFHSAAYSDDGSMIVAGSAQGDVYIWNSTTGERLRRLNGLNAAVLFVMSTDGASHVVAIDANGNGMTWQLTEGTDVGSEFTMQGRRFDACEGMTVATALSPSKKWLVAASADSLRVWNVSSLSSGAMIKQHGDTARITQRIYSVAIDDDAKRIAIGSDGGEVHVRQVEN